MKNSPFCRLVMWLFRSGCIQTFSVHSSSTIHFTAGCLFMCVSSASVLCVWQYLGGISGFLKLPSEPDGRWKIYHVADVISRSFFWMCWYFFLLSENSGLPHAAWIHADHTHCSVKDKITKFNSCLSSLQGMTIWYYWTFLPTSYHFCTIKAG